MLFHQVPSDEELEASGFTAEDYVLDDVDVWPENWPAFELFNALQTQWRIGLRGPIGLDYNVLYHKMDRMQLDPDEYDQLESDVRVMEMESLATMRSK